MACSGVLRQGEGVLIDSAGVGDDGEYFAVGGGCIEYQAVIGGYPDAAASAVRILLMRGRIELCGNAASSFMSFAEASPVKMSSAWLEAASMMLSNPVRLWAAAVAPMETVSTWPSV